MSTKPAIPTAADVVGPGVERLVEVRPSVAAHLGPGAQYGNVVEGWRAQFERARVRLNEEHVAARLTLASGEALTDVAASEYDADRRSETFAVGEVTLVRAVIHYRPFGPAVGSPNATDGESAVALLQEIAGALTAHFAAEYSATTGLGPHARATPEIEVAPVGDTPTMALLCDAANTAKSLYNLHVENGGGPEEDYDFTGVHVSADSVNPVTVKSATYNSGGAPFEDNSTPSQQSLLRLVNGLKAAINSHFSLAARPGTIRKGHRFEVSGSASAVPPIASSLVEVTQDTPVSTGQDSVVVDVRGTLPGVATNQPAWLVAPARTFRSVDALYDPSFSVAAIAAAGGGTGQLDTELVQAAKARWTGRYGPTRGALLAGALSDFGASRTVIREDVSGGRCLVYAVDESWAQSARWLSVLAGRLSESRTGWLGWGCRMATPPVINRLVRVELEVVLRDSSFLAATAGITELIQREIAIYFNERPDWYVWRRSAIRGLVARTDRRIMTCAQADVLDGDGLPLAEPAVPATGVDVPLTHWWLADAAVSVTYTSPS